MPGGFVGAMHDDGPTCPPNSISLSPTHPPLSQRSVNYLCDSIIVEYRNNKFCDKSNLEVTSYINNCDALIKKYEKTECC